MDSEGRHSKGYLFSGCHIFLTFLAGGKGPYGFGNVPKYGAKGGHMKSGSLKMLYLMFVPFSFG